MLEKQLGRAEKKALEEVRHLLVDGEVTESIHFLGSDHVLFTNLRIICVDFSFQDKSTTLVAIPYRNVLAVGTGKPVGLKLMGHSVVIYTAAGKTHLKAIHSEPCKKVAQELSERTL